MSDNFEPGDVVLLKSGGPEMVIEMFDHYGGQKFAHCKWFSGNQMQMKVFAVTGLKKASESA